MPKAGLKSLRHHLSPACCCLALALITTAVLAQNATGTSPDAQDLKTLMILARDSNGLTSPNMKPWHLKASYQLLDSSGNPAKSGTFEEYWASKDKYKQVYKGKDFAMVDYYTDKGLFRSGALDPVPAQLFQATQQLYEPLLATDQYSYSLKELDSNGIRLRCLRLSSPTYDPGITYCLDSEKPILRIASYARLSFQVLSSRIMTFQGQFVAGDLQLTRDGKTTLTLHIDEIATLESVDDADFLPSSDAALVPRKISIASGVAGTMLVHKVTPEYPPDALNARISGTVVLQVLVGKDGHIEDLKVISGYPGFQKAAMDAVRQWVYRPYLLNGEPVEFNTTVSVVFSLGG